MENKAENRAGNLMDDLMEQTMDSEDFPETEKGTRSGRRNDRAEEVIKAMPEDFEIVTTVYRDSPSSHVSSQVPLVLLHAFPVDHRVWDRCADRLVTLSEEEGRAYPILAPDMPGAGMSPVPTDDLTGPVNPDGSYAQAADRLAVSFVHAVQALGYRKAVWAGISMGGYLALAIQRLFPQTVAGLILLDTRADRDLPQGLTRRLSVADDALKNHSVASVMHFAQPQEGDSTFKRSEEFLSAFTSWIDQQSPAGVAWRQRMAAGRQDETPTLAQVTAPAAVVSGLLDRSSNPSVMKPLAAAMGKTTVDFHPIPDAGHFTCFEKPDQVAQVLDGTMARVLEERK